MTNRSLILLVCMWTLGLSGASSAPQSEESANWVMSSPSGDRYVERTEEGPTIIPNGRILTPAGKQYRIQPHPYGMALSPDGHWLVTANSGRPICLSILDVSDPSNPKIYQVPENPKEHEGVLDAVFMGLVFLTRQQDALCGGWEGLECAGFRSGHAQSSGPHRLCI